MTLELARTVADAVLFEGYLLYPYKATSRKNQVRWQFGVLGPPGAAEAGVGEERGMSTQCLLRSGPDARVTVHLRFLQLQSREVQEAVEDATRFEPVSELTLDDRTWLTWDEAVEHEIELNHCLLTELVARGQQIPVQVDGGEDVELILAGGSISAGRLVRRRWPLQVVVSLRAVAIDELVRLEITVENVGPPPEHDKDQAIRTSLIGAHLLVRAERAQFVSLLEPPDDAKAAVSGCSQQRCWPVLTGAPGETDVLLVSPIILYDYPEIADQSAGALFDSTEIDEILTLRVMTLTDEEKAEARATDPRAGEIIDRCESMTPEALAQLHGILRDPHAGMAVPVPEPLEGLIDTNPASAQVDAGDGVPEIRNVDPPSFDTGGVPWWDPEADASVQPGVDAVLVNGVAVARDSLVRLHPSRRADAQDLFFSGRVAKVSAVLSDVDGNVHVAVVLHDDPAADLHDWYGRYLYFAPEELEPLDPPPGENASPELRKESSS